MQTLQDPPLPSPGPPDRPPTTVNSGLNGTSILNRGRGYSTTKGRNAERQRSATSTAARSHDHEDGLVSAADTAHILTRTQSVTASPTRFPARTLSRSQSTVSVIHPGGSPSPSRHADGQDSFASRNSSVNGRRDATSPPPMLPLSNLNGLQQVSSANTSAARQYLPISVSNSVLTSTKSFRQVDASEMDVAVVNPRAELGSISNFALEQLYTAFADQANAKIELCCTPRVRLSDQIEDVCAAGIDYGFDQLLSAMGRVVRRKPKPLIDKLMLWKGDWDSLGSQPVKSTLSSPDPGKRSIDIVRGLPDLRASHATIVRANNKVPTYNPDLEVNDRRSSAATYLLCRALIEILNQTTLSSLSAALAVKLEDIAFEGTASKITQDAMRKSSLQRAKWMKAVELLGVLSRLDFSGVMGRYLRELQLCHPTLADKTAHDRLVVESRAQSLLKGMGQLQPLVEQGGTKDIPFRIELTGRLTTIQTLFADVHGHEIKTAFCCMIEGLLLRLARANQVMVVDPKWQKVVISLHDNLGKLVTKPKYWANAYPAQIALTCVSPADIFTQRWQPILKDLPARLKERNQRVIALKAVCRLAWCSLRRNADTSSTSTKLLEDLVKTVFFSGRKYSFSRDPLVSESLIRLIRIIGSSLPEFCFKTIIFPLINVDLLMTKDTVAHQALDPDRIILGVQATLGMINDLENTEKPVFPLTFQDEPEGWGSLSDKPFLPPQTHKRSQIRQDPETRGGKSSKPIFTMASTNSLKANYLQFCEALGKILRVCDHAFGGQAVLDERFSSPTARTPLADPWRFARDDDRERFGDERLGFYDLLHVSVQALPRFLSSHTPINELANLLCTGTAHVEEAIAKSSATSLKSIARQGYAQIIVARFSAFIFRYENLYATMSDGGLLGPAHIESTLRLYVELLQVWIDELHHKAKDANSEASSETSHNARSGQLDITTSRLDVDRVEAQGLFFLCSPSHRVRHYAVEVLEAVTRLDKALGETNVRIHGVLTSNSLAILDLHDVTLSVSEYARLQKAMLHSTSNDTLTELCKSGDPADANLWSKAFPRLVKVAEMSCTVSVAQTRDDVCSRLSQLQPAIEGLTEERSRAPTVSSVEGVTSRAPPKVNTSLTDVAIEQWKLYLVFACTTINRTSHTGASVGQESSHTRQGSRSSQGGHDTITTATELFAKVVPLLYAESPRVRSAAVAGLGSVNINLYRLLLDALASISHPQNRNHGRSASHYHVASSPQRQSPRQIFQAEVVQVYELTSHFLRDSDAVHDEAVMDHMSSLTRDLAFHLGQGNAQSDNSRLRRHFCGLLESFYLSLDRTEDPTKWMPFQTRKATYVALEEWCDQLAPAEHSKSRYVDGRNALYLSPAHTQVENQKLRLAAWSAMATLCAGPMQVSVAGGASSQFSVPRMLAWIDTLLKSEGDKPQNIGRRALRNLIQHNQKYTTLTESTIERLYGSESEGKEKQDKTLDSYLDVLTEVFGATDIPMIAPWKIVSALLFTLGHTWSGIRTKSLRLLRAIEERHNKAPKLRNYDIMVSDKTRAVNLRAHYGLVCEIIEQHEDYVYFIFSMYARHLVDQSADAQRGMIRTLLPWMKLMDLQIDSEGKPTATSYMVLFNMLYITVKCGTVLHTEIQALWHGLITGNYGGNVSSILDFVINTSLECRDESFIRVAKQVMVYMASVEEGKAVVEFFMKRIDPRTMAGPDKRISVRPPPGTEQLPFVAGMSQIFPNSGPQARLSMGQLSLVLLVDLVVDDHRLALERLPTLLQIVLVLWDHHLEIVQDQAREMLVHLVHVLVISKVKKSIFESREPSIEDLVDLIRRHDPKVVWKYTDNSSQSSPYELPSAMTYVVSEAVSLFALTVPSVAESWGEVALTWALQCPVKHLACRSLQLYRCLHTPVSQRLFLELVLRSSTTVADDAEDMQAYATELIRTVRTLVQKLQPDSTVLHQAFWFTCACLDSIHEWEYHESLPIVDVMLDHLKVRENSIVDAILRAKPPRWQGKWTGLIELLYKGCQSSKQLEQTLSTLGRLIARVPDPLVGNEHHLCLVLLAHMPRFLNSFEDASVRDASLPAASSLKGLFCAQGFTSMAKDLEDYASGSFGSKDDFLKRCVRSLKVMLALDAQVAAVKLLLSLLVNPLPWMQLQTLVVLSALLPVLHPVGPDVLHDGPDLFHPLLQLLQTDLCSEALNVVDLLLPASDLAAGQQQLPANRLATAKRSDTQPKLNQRQVDASYISSGWLVPSPAERQRQVRENLYALADVLWDQESAEPAPMRTPEGGFYHDEIPVESYFPNERAQSIADTATMTETNMGELVSQLDSLDDFFAEVEDVNESGAQPDLGSFMPANGQIHSRRQRRISSKGGKTLASVTTNGHTTMPTIHQGSRITAPHEPHIMSPSAFAKETSSDTDHTPARPSISRSVTTPNGDFDSMPPEQQRSTAPFQDLETFSDDDRVGDHPNALTHAATMIDSNGTIRPNVSAGKPKFGLRNSIKRLASSASADRHRRSPTTTTAKSQVSSESSPQVPKVPEAYLQNSHVPQSSEL